MSVTDVVGSMANDGSGRNLQVSILHRQAIIPTCGRNHRHEPANRGRMQKVFVQAFYDETTATISYVVHDKERGGTAAVIDPVWDFDPASGKLESRSAGRILAYVRQRNLDVAWILETHAHADHLSAAQWLKARLGGRVAIGGRIAEVQRHFYPLFHPDNRYAPDGSPFDHLFAEGDRFTIGTIPVRVMHTPGHTPACITYVIGDDEAAFVGDTIFMPDYGTARADFPGGDARTLYHSIRRILTELRPETRLFMCHDYRPGGRPPRWKTTVAEERAHNIHVHDGIDEETFVRLRQERDAQLAAPRLLYPSLQVNIRAGRLPDPEANGRRYLKIPLIIAENARE